MMSKTSGEPTLAPAPKGQPAGAAPELSPDLAGKQEAVPQAGTPTLPGSTPGARIPVIPRRYIPPKLTMGTVPAVCAEGFEASRIPDSSSARSHASSLGQVIVCRGDRNPDDPGALLVQNQDVFATNEQNELTYKGDLVVVWRTEYADAWRAEQAEKAKRATEGVKTTKSPLGESVVPPQLAEITADLSQHRS